MRGIGICEMFSIMCDKSLISGFGESVTEITLRYFIRSLLGEDKLSFDSSLLSVSNSSCLGFIVKYPGVCLPLPAMHGGAIALSFVLGRMFLFLD